VKRRCGDRVDADRNGMAPPALRRFLWPLHDGYRGGYIQSWAARNGFVCQPGTWFKGEDGRRHICQ